jgi:hypothetical protein
MPQAGRVVFGNMEAVTFGRPAAEALAEEARRGEAERVFLMTRPTRSPNCAVRSVTAMPEPSIICRRTRRAMPSSRRRRWRATPRPT